MGTGGRRRIRDKCVSKMCLGRDNQDALDERRGVRVVNVVGDGPIARVSFRRYDREYNPVCTRRLTLLRVSLINFTPHGSLVAISSLNHEK